MMTNENRSEPSHKKTSNEETDTLEQAEIKDTKETGTKDNNQDFIYKFPENYPGKELNEEIDKLEDLEDEQAIEKLDALTEKNDEIIEREEFSSVVKQNKTGKIVFFQVLNIYSNANAKRFRNRYSMRKNPPVLLIQDDEEQEVQIILTENLVDELGLTIKDVKRAYYGFSGPSDIKAPKGKKEKIKYYLNKNKFKIIGGLVILGFLIGFGLQR